MPSQQLRDFSGGIQTRLPGHRIGQTESVEAINVDLSYSDIRSDTEIGGEGGGSGYFYESGNTWVSAEGTGGQTFNSLTVSSNTTLSSSLPSGTNDTTNGITRYAYNVANPVTVGQNVTLTIGAGTGGSTASNPAHNGVALIVNNLEQGIGQADSFVEYNDDLYIGRNKFEVPIEQGTTRPSIANVNNLAQITVAISEVVKFIEGDEIEAEGLPPHSRVKEINVGTGVITLNQAATSTGNNRKLTVNVVPIRIIDGDMENIYPVGIDKPEPVYEITQLGDNGARVAPICHSTNWYTENYPIPFQYGVARFDTATLAESPLSELSDRQTSQGIVGSNTTSSPLMASFGLSDAGKYAIYRVGGTSAVLKKVANFYDAGDTNIDVTVTVNLNGTAGHITLEPTNLPSGCEFKFKWLAYNGRTYGTTNAHGDAIVRGETDYTTTPGTINFYGFQGTSAATQHAVDIECLIRFPDETNPVDTNEYIVKGINIAGTVASKADMIDFMKPRALIDIEPFQNADRPPLNGKFITEVNNFFFLSVSKRLHISSFGAPNSWPTDAYLDFESPITGISDRASELIVFTETGVFRCYGNDASEFRKVKIGTTEGVPTGLHKCIAKIREGTIYVSNSGICFYNGESVENLTKNKLGSFTPPSTDNFKNLAGTIDDQYYLLSEFVDGYKLDFKFGSQKISRSKLRATSLHYRGNTNKLYSEAGAFFGGNKSLFNLTTRDFDGGDILKDKVFSKVTVKGTNFSGNIKINIDGSQDDSFTISNEVQNLNRSFYLSNGRIANILSVEFEDCSGIITEISVEFEFAESFKKSRFDSVDITYTGSPTVSFKIDNVTKINNITLPDPGIDNTGLTTLFFPALSEGAIPHLISTEDESSTVLSHQYKQELI